MNRPTVGRPHRVGRIRSVRHLVLLDRRQRQRAPRRRRCRTARLVGQGRERHHRHGLAALRGFTAVLFAVVTNHVLLLAGDRSRHWAAFARSMAAAFTATLLVSAALRGVIGHLVKVEDGPLPGIDVLRYTTALNYTVLAMVVMTTFALTAIALGVLVLRSGILARWQGYVGTVLGALVLAAAAGLVGAYTVPVAILWSLSTAVAIWPRAGVATPEVPVARADESAAV